MTQKLKARKFFFKVGVWHATYRSVKPRQAAVQTLSAVTRGSLSREGVYVNGETIINRA